MEIINQEIIQTCSWAMEANGPILMEMAMAIINQEQTQMLFQWMLHNLKTLMMTDMAIINQGITLMHSQVNQHSGVIATEMGLEITPMG